MAVSIFGILNITEDSFSDGGKYLAADRAIAHAHLLIEQGADAIDIGAVASNPEAKVVSADEEIARLAPVVRHLVADGISVSIDSFSPLVQAWALKEGVAFLNDIAGFADEALYPVLAKSQAGLILMHSVQQGQADRRETPQGDLMAHIGDFFARRLEALEKAGVARKRVTLDPGMGLFLGNREDASFEVLRRLRELNNQFGLPVLISVSRKGFLRKATGRPVADIGPATLAAEILAIQNGADCIRTHEPGPLRDALKVLAAAKGGA